MSIYHINGEISSRTRCIGVEDSFSSSFQFSAPVDQKDERESAKAVAYFWEFFVL